MYVDGRSDDVVIAGGDESANQRQRRRLAILRELAGKALGILPETVDTESSRRWGALEGNSHYSEESHYFVSKGGWKRESRGCGLRVALRRPARDDHSRYQGSV